MIIYTDSDFSLREPTAVTIGNFDGIHLGHQKLIKTVQQYAEKKNIKSVMFSFYPHPVGFFGREKSFKTMLNVPEKIIAAKITGIDILIQYPFTEKFAALSPTEFIDVLKEKTNCEYLVVGNNYLFGKNRGGNINTLKELGKERGISVVGIQPVEVDGKRVSSTRIRELIENGDMENTARLLNKPYFIIGQVEHGQKLGRLMSFPTINIAPPEDKLLPPSGVYFSIVYHNNKKYFGMSNVGTKPTFNNNNKTIETNIFDFNEGNIYDQEVLVCLCKRIREIKKFDSMDTLKKQLINDKNTAIELSKKYIFQSDQLSDYYIHQK